MVNEKVLGFKEKDAFIWEDGECRITKDKFVPVVSVEELERICRQLIMEHMAWDSGKDYLEGIGAVIKSVRLQVKVLKKK